jgi:Ca2+-binding RTX toxin-like protein
VITGGTGTDTLVGGLGDDSYHFARDDGSDVINDFESSPNNDQVLFGANISHDQLWFSQSGDDLRIDLIGTTDRIVINDWYQDSGNQIETFMTDDGLSLMNTQVDQLVQAMAAFTPPASGEIDLTANLRTQLEPVITANWQ